MNNFVLNMFTSFKQNTNSFKLYIFNNKNYMSLEANTGEKKRRNGCWGTKEDSFC